MMPEHLRSVSGLGVSQMPFFLAEAVFNGSLEEVLSNYRPPEIPVWLLS